MVLIRSLSPQPIERLVPGQQPEDSPSFQPVSPLRPLASTDDTYDQDLYVDYAHDAFFTGRRPMYNIPLVSVTASKVGTIKTSANVQGYSPSYVKVGGTVSSPNTNINTYTVMPNMLQTIRASGPVQVNFSVNVSTVNANDPMSIAVFRNGLQVSQTYQGSGAANTSFLMSGSFTDNPPSGVAVYDIRWAKGSSAVTATGTQRTLQVLNLRAQ